MPVCDSCGRTVTLSFARVFGDNQNEVAGCVSCMSGEDLQHGSAAGIDDA